MKCNMCSHLKKRCLTHGINIHMEMHKNMKCICFKRKQAYMLKKVCCHCEDLTQK